LKVLLDTHLLLWAGLDSDQLPKAARDMILDPGIELMFSAANLWEIVIKNSLGREDFKVSQHTFRTGLLQNGYLELPISSDHTIAVANLPNLHKDPFDRILVAQATVEGITLLTADPLVIAYPGPIVSV
jgi:PIN domain nuclease of toxin-antitoxin system